MTNQDDIFSQLGTIALIGGGRMGEAIVAGLVQGALLSPEAIIVAEPSSERRHFLTQNFGVRSVENGAQISHPQTCILAVKPQVVRTVAHSLAQEARFRPERVISIAAGIHTSVLTDIFPQAQVVRVMPNAPLLVGAGMSAVAMGENTSVTEGRLVQALFSLLGEAVLLDESLIDAATALSGSGPAYFAFFVEQLISSGQSLGLPAAVAEQLALQTFMGTARQLQLSSVTPAELRDAVTSPGGTTQAALESLEADDLAAIVRRAVTAAWRRAVEMA
ncbi:MAG: pyrroline-5-carboxylate reductase [Coriobacteriales bacterium]|jgi:pyrroline-5-carboxylate reductase|nr:pyrroline-5-carboxylate reductase [Coriobacteriales bacterium]